MDRRKTSKSSKRTAKRQTSPRKATNCSNKIKTITQVLINRSLYRKYGYSQNHHYLSQYKVIEESALSVGDGDGECEQFLGRYYKNTGRRVLMLKLKQVYKMHRQIPRIFHFPIKDILFKCYHRKRLLDYFKIAKILGMKVESVNFSSFLLSINLSRNNPETHYEKVLMESLQHSGTVERMILLELDNGR